MFFHRSDAPVLIVIYKLLVIPAGKRVSSAMDGKLMSIHGAWTTAIHDGMTDLCVTMSAPASPQRRSIAG
jgi:hypothetical protein